MAWNIASVGRKADVIAHLQEQHAALVAQIAADVASHQTAAQMAQDAAAEAEKGADDAIAAAIEAKAASDAEVAREASKEPPETPTGVRRTALDMLAHDVHELARQAETRRAAAAAKAAKLLGIANDTAARAAEKSTSAPLETADADAALAQAIERIGLIATDGVRVAASGSRTADGHDYHVSVTRFDLAPATTRTQ